MEALSKQRADYYINSHQHTGTNFVLPGKFTQQRILGIGKGVDFERAQMRIGDPIFGDAGRFIGCKFYHSIRTYTAGRNNLHD